MYKTKYLHDLSHEELLIEAISLKRKLDLIKSMLEA